MRPKDPALVEELLDRLNSFAEVTPLPGLSGGRVECFVGQIVESTRRVRYARQLCESNRLGAQNCDPESPAFDPLKAAVVNYRGGNIDEAFWLVFLAIHFGKHRSTGWRLVRDVYSGLGQGRWNWDRIAGGTTAFRQWLSTHLSTLKSFGRFGNHRRYESLNPYSARGTGSVIESYVKWVNPPRTHAAMMEQVLVDANHNPKKAFDIAYRSMKQVMSFGRLSRFDYLTMISKLGFANVEPGSIYTAGATGPMRGARLLVGGSVSANVSAKEVDRIIEKLASHLGLESPAMQILEDALCNWQKSPHHFIAFRG